MNAKDIEVILFDLGGVLVELGDSPFPKDWQKKNTLMDATDWLRSSVVIDFESGKISAEQFAKSLIQAQGLEVSPKALLAEFTAWPKAIYPEVPSLLSKLKENYRLVVLLNSNELHWPRILNEFNLTPYFDRLFSSHLIKTAKPDADAFRHVLNSIKTEPEKVLFFDDNAANVRQARKLGMYSALVNGVKDIEVFLLQNHFKYG